ncbi:hypothetical protein BT63DRAFT_480570 [Microthyrium microscopicum]|uniref:Uncharacterized protein n=1 Tax=Microthyrium microscopicum TaxID=703497 RepID=A0A6A6U643_9PEZI|nr:hypothetical protein BT63DRAFT_480570 [Microthyrium microscopicum]
MQSSIHGQGAKRKLVVEIDYPEVESGAKIAKLTSENAALRKQVVELTQARDSDDHESISSDPTPKSEEHLAWIYSDEFMRDFQQCYPVQVTGLQEEFQEDSPAEEHDLCQQNDQTEVAKEAQASTSNHNSEATQSGPRGSNKSSKANWLARVEQLQAKEGNLPAAPVELECIVYCQECSAEFHPDFENFAAEREELCGIGDMCASCIMFISQHQDCY